MSIPRPSAFDWDLARIAHRDNLPHVRQANVIYFVTFRLGDSLPEKRVALLRERRDEWLRLHPEPHSEAEVREYRGIWTTRIERLLDAGHGACVLGNPSARDVLEKVMLWGDGSHYHLGDFVIMPSHVHALLQPLAEHELSEIMKAWKSTSARRIGCLLGRRGSYWMDEYFDHAVRDEGSLGKFVRYIRKNPQHLPHGTFTVDRGSLQCGR